MPIGTPTSIGNAAATTNATTLTITTTAAITAGNLVVVFIFADNSIGTFASSVSDGTNTYTQDKTRSFGSGSGAVEVWHIENAAAVSSGASLTITWSSTATAPLIAAACQVSGIVTSGAFDSSGSNSAAGTSASPSVSWNTLAQANEIIFGFVALDLSKTISTEDSAFTALFSNITAGANDLHVGYNIVNSQSSGTYGPTASGNCDWGVIAAPYEGAAATDVLMAQVLT